ncbi:Cof-type HAD-IIB family hydrolase [Paenibacillus cremeus]|uniref:HAD family phosphatase n=1 Tax=Paenibacillus cremeus TaxID=2163881 RepID=A0A559KD64_9BACL|nr:Cof-type HAD-IIB family hydrolase [Paenibacillus cremeus]TVY10029.1 HAD family phosphatase [Paenibacillus cremeus]
MTIKLIALDMDGTLLNESKQISQQNTEWIAKCSEQGVHVILSTGRGIHKIRPYLKQLQLESSLIVAVNGGEVWKGPDELLFRQTISAEVIEALRQLAHELDVWYWGYHSEGKPTRDSWGDRELQGSTLLQWVKFGFQSDDPDKIAQLYERIPSIGAFELTNSHPSNIEVNPAGITKASGLHQVCNLLDVGMHEVAAMGDSMNDMSMITEAALGIAMGNAQEEVKRRADAVTDTNDEDGVAKAIQRYIFSS